ncbi:DEAD/DEAH box helicase [Ruficoccus amylovorans]|uniref:DEAD-box ATP-dependent RNA helicase RhpA n=1 Tax=Ruficoccus amylovorans TaxID=1804625 RepID=A0A842HGQ1_9BACT|nr:DEAD/DEAH box helicase [Ruficoccus amylovorans]MBC2594734.1 DEAD/DEAH box helicase [Ruficoccus amylovorans]
MSDITFHDLPLAEPLHRALGDHDYQTPSPIQAQAIPVILEGRDLLGSAQTGTGKTAAFALPILHRIHTRPRELKPREVRALVLVPTRELAVQVDRSFEKYGTYVDFRALVVYGGVGFENQIQTLNKGVEVLVATPGRLLDLHSQGCVDLSNVKVLVLDEADRMLDMGFLPDMRRIISLLPKERQTLFLSATLGHTIQSLAKSILTDPVTVSVAPPSSTAEKIEQEVLFVRSNDKADLLAHLLQKMDDDEVELMLVFSRTKHGAERLVKKLRQAGIQADTIHGDKTQVAREKALDKFREGKVKVLVATDVAARGIDVKGISHVVNYDFPNQPESYVHRIGRTARAGEEGKAITFCADEDMNVLWDVEKMIRQPITIRSDHPYHCEDLAEVHLGRREALKKITTQERPRRRNRGGGPVRVRKVF